MLHNRCARALFSGSSYYTENRSDVLKAKFENKLDHSLSLFAFESERHFQKCRSEIEQLDKRVANAIKSSHRCELQR